MADKQPIDRFPNSDYRTIGDLKIRIGEMRSQCYGIVRRLTGSKKLAREFMRRYDAGEDAETVMTELIERARRRRR